jgi:uncharacterized protein YhbP (UPF0306 family)
MNERIAGAKTMQIATLRGGQPWICTVYFILHQKSLYWLSEPDRRHSKELADHPDAAAAIVLKQDVPVTGIQMQGSVQVVTDIREAETVLPLYVGKYGQGGRFVQRLKLGTNRHVLYKLIPDIVMLFDEDGSPASPYRQITL